MTKKISTKDRIIDEATSLFWRFGYDGVFMDAVCEAANVKKGSLYHAFASKAELVDATLEKVWERDRADIAAIYASSLEKREQLFSHFEWFGVIQRRLKVKFGFVPGTFNMAIGGNAPSSTLERIRMNRDEHLDILKVAIEEVLQGEDRAPNSSKWMGAMLVNVITGVLINARLGNTLEGFENLPESLFALMGLASPPICNINEEVGPGRHAEREGGAPRLES